MTSPSRPTVEAVLHAAVDSVGGEDRPGQVEMALAVRAAMESGQHLLVQAGTGTGKSLAYLVPALLHEDRVVVATATLALQHQLVERDIPALLAAAAEVLGAEPSYAVLKGRSNYACLHRMRDGVPDDQGTLVDLPRRQRGRRGAPAPHLGREGVQAAAAPGDRDSAPAHTDRVWRQVSVNHRECLGAAKCPYGVECFAERARERAMRSSLVVTNHSLLAIDAIEGVPMIPDYDDGRDRRGARAGRPGHPGGDRRAVAARSSSEPPAEPGTSSTVPSPDDLSDAVDVLRAALDDVAPQPVRRAAGGGRRRARDGAGLRADHHERVSPGAGAGGG